MKEAKIKKVTTLMLFILIFTIISNVFINKVSAAEAATGSLKVECGTYSNNVQVLFGVLDEDGEYVDFDEEGALIGKNNDYEFRVEITSVESRELVSVPTDWENDDPVYSLVEDGNGVFEERTIYK